MTRSHSLTGSLLLLVILSASKPASAQEISLEGWGDGVGRTADAIGLVYAVGGTLTFLAVDLAFAAQGKTLAMEAAVPQFIYATTLLCGSAIAATQGDGGVSAGLLATGGILIGLPIISFATQGARDRSRTALRLTPTAIVVSGTF